MPKQSPKKPQKKKKPTPLNICIGKNIKSARKKAGYTQEVFSELADQSVSSVSRLENGKSMVSVAQLYKISNIFDIFIGDFFIDLVDPVKYPQIQESVTVSPSARHQLYYIREDAESMPIVRDKELNMLIERLPEMDRQLLKDTLRRYIKGHNL